MPEIRADFRIDKLEAKVKLVEEKEDGMVVERHLITEVKVQYEGTPVWPELVQLRWLETYRELAGGRK